jgi:hypothetical protein
VFVEADGITVFVQLGIAEGLDCIKDSDESDTRCRVRLFFPEIVDLTGSERE